AVLPRQPRRTHPRPHEEAAPRLRGGERRGGGVNLVEKIKDWWLGPITPAEEGLEQTARCVSDLGPRQRHLYEGAPVCLRCGVENPKYVEPEVVATPTEGL